MYVHVCVLHNKNTRLVIIFAFSQCAGSQDGLKRKVKNS